MDRRLRLGDRREQGGGGAGAGRGAAHGGRLHPGRVPRGALHADLRRRRAAEAAAGVKVYLDAGNPAWIEDPEKIAGPLRRAGIAQADGFSLNVSNFQTDTATRAYGKALSERLDGAHYVVDTSRNGNGPLGAAGQDAWCNPPGRALGTPPTTRTGDPLLDAYLWIKRPGESDGSCRGGPSAGTWWPEYALGLARNTKG